MIGHQVPFFDIAFSLSSQLLAQLRMGVRVDREGLLMRDFQTATGVMTGDGKVKPKRTVTSHRFYLADAAFLVGLEGTDRSLPGTIQAVLRAPVWPLALGRKAFPPGQPVWLENDLVDADLRHALVMAPPVATQRHGHKDKPYRLILEHDSVGSVRLDQPLAPFSQRRFGPRYVASEVIPCSSPS